MDFILIAVIVLGAIGLVAALVLFAASKKFAVYEDPRIAQVSELLPGANCGGCGFAGCGWFRCHGKGGQLARYGYCQWRAEGGCRSL